MALNSWPLTHIELYGLLWVLVVLLLSPAGYGTQTDWECITHLRKSFQDPSNYLSSWDLSNTTEGSICNFVGIECWHRDESRVLSIRLEDMNLTGPFPRGIQNCTSLNELHLSGNQLNGSLPLDIDKLIPFVTKLELSNNKFTGEIPPMIRNCSFLNLLHLDNNQFSGTIPPGIVDLGRLNDFTVANNNLSGPIPQFYNNTFSADSFANNPGLCGSPLVACKVSKKKSNTGLIAGVAAGVFIVVLTIMGIGLFYVSRVAVVKRKKKKDDDPEGNKWAKSMKGTKEVKVSMFEEMVTKMSLSDLMKATDSFSNNNIIGKGSSGIMYKAVLPDGTFLMVKRLHDSQRTENEFVSEMDTLGRVKHKNLAPLLGYCMAKSERFLVYKYMANGNLFDQLHPVDPDVKVMEWTLRLKIAIGAARGLSWLHHNCNPRIIHRSISSKCILLDEDFEPKLSDFGLARLMNPVDTHLSTFVNGGFGELGYVAPEYASTLRATPKGDIYSFGTVLLELITGEKPTRVEKAPESFKGSLVEWVTHLSNSSETRCAIDKSLLGQGYDHELNQFMKVACNCISPMPKDRPTMFEVYQLLRAIGERYHFTANDDILLPSNMDEDCPDELIVAGEPVSTIR